TNTVHNVIDTQVSHAHEGILVTAPARPAQHRAYAADDLLEAEGLGDVHVAAHREPGDLVGGVIARGELLHGCVFHLLAQAPSDAEAVEVRQHHVEHDEVGGDRHGAAQRTLAIAHRLYLEAVEPQGRGEQFTDVRFIVNNEKSCLTHTCSVRALAVSFLRIR